MNIDISKIPFSKYGSMLSVGEDKTAKALIVRNIRQKWGLEHTFNIYFYKHGKALEFSLQTTPYAIKVYAHDGSACIYLKNDEELVIDSEGLDVNIELAAIQRGFGYKEADNRYKFMALHGQACIPLVVLNGSVTDNFERVVNKNFHVNTKNELKITTEEKKILVHMRISAFEKKQEAIEIDTQKDIALVRKEWEEFLAKMPEVPERYNNCAELQWYTLWSCFVRAEGILKSDGILMSKGSMAAIWSWDHCFNALAMSKADKKVALEQFFLLFEHQTDIGALPDLISSNTMISMVSKPPVHGWCFDRIMNEHDLDNAVLEKAYKHLEAWTNWYFEYRDTDKDGIPNYNFGCDSGWDNSSLFDQAGCLEAPDLSAFLFIQMKVLGKIAVKLGNTYNANEWNHRAEELLVKLFDHSWTENGFIAKVSGSHKYEENHTSLLILMPIILGEYLPEEKMNILVDRLCADFLTPNGLATERLNSPKYAVPGYWRGPIWAPSTYLIVDGLKRSGRNELALKIAEGFCEMVKNAGGAYENYDAITGEGLDDMGYTWTCSVAILFMNEYLKG